MRFMGDHPIKGLSEQEVVSTFLKLIGEFSLMKDEAYCQLLKQVSANTSSKPYVRHLLCTRHPQHPQHPAPSTHHPTPQHTAPITHSTQHPTTRVTHHMRCS
ncbi:hypothetical protein CRUP_032295, partial [Coryphaenoides rupestris]